MHAARGSHFARRLTARVVAGSRLGRIVPRSCCWAARLHLDRRSTSPFLPLPFPLQSRPWVPGCSKAASHPARHFCGRAHKRGMRTQTTVADRQREPHCRGRDHTALATHRHASRRSTEQGEGFHRSQRSRRLDRIWDRYGIAPQQIASFARHANFGMERLQGQQARTPQVRPASLTRGWGSELAGMKSTGERSAGSEGTMEIAPQ